MIPTVAWSIPQDLPGDDLPPAQSLFPPLAYRPLYRGFYA